MGPDDLECHLRTKRVKFIPLQCLKGTFQFVDRLYPPDVNQNRPRKISSTRYFPGKSRQAIVLRVEMDPSSLFRRLQSVPTNSTGAGSGDLYTSYVVPPTKDAVASVVVNILMVLLASIWTVLRFYARRLKGQSWYFEDLLCLFALVRPARSIRPIFPRRIFAIAAEGL